MGIFDKGKELWENIQYFLEPTVVQKIEQPFETKEKEKTTEFGEPGQIKDVDIVSAGAYNSIFQLGVNSDGTMNDMIYKYRKMAEMSFVDDAVTEIVNESIFRDEYTMNKDIVRLDFNDENNKISEKVREIIVKEFKTLLDILDFDDTGQQFFKQWFVDGRLIVQCIYDIKNIKKGILKVKLMSPINMKRHYDESKDKRYWVYKVTDVNSKENSYTDVRKKGDDFYAYVPDELVVFVPSGKYAMENRIPISYLHTAIKDVNRLDTLEDHFLIYRIVRSPERRVFYIDPGNVPAKKAEAYLRQIMATYKQNKIYNETDGTLISKNKHPSMLEDFFLLRRNDKGTQIDTVGNVGCLSLDTKIPLLDGRNLMLSEMVAEYNNGKQNWVYSCNPENGEVVPGKVDWAGITHKNADVIKLTFDNGEFVTCTPDHKFPIIGKGFVEAKDLNVGQSMIPFHSDKEIKIINIEVQDKIDVGTLTIDAKHVYHDYHTFALSCGVFTKNSLGEIDDLFYFQRKAALALKVPFSRVNHEDRQSTSVMSATANEITREELKFSRYIISLRGFFSQLFLKLLKKQLVSKNIIAIKEWDNIKRKIFFKYNSDTRFAQAKRLSNLEQQINILRDMEEMVGKWYTKDDVFRKVLGKSSPEIKEHLKILEEEKVRFKSLEDEDDDDAAF